MQSNNYAGIITYRETKMPQLLSLLAQPNLADSIIIEDGVQCINIFLFDCPVNGGKVDKKRYRLLRELVDKNKVKFLVERFETKVQSNVSPKKNEIHYSQLLPEIRAIKQLAAFIKVSQDRQENLLEGDIGFIMGRIDSLMIDLLSEEASNVMLYEEATITEQIKHTLHNHFMEKKGVSIVFTKDIRSIIKQSTTLGIDEFIDLSAYKELLNNKVIIGKSKDSGIKSITNIVLWSEALKTHKSDSIPLKYNDEILAIMRYYNINLDILDFIKRLPYIYFDH
ncbi:MAG: hypothetical protein K0R80_2605 [Clostridia bacterium]|jgi:hypothetical protein|nr:hypothetical protein [Clostridia bacterium]